jgi:hypothetical protein
MATAVFAKMLDNFQDSTRLIAESRSFTLNSSRENLRTRMTYTSTYSLLLLWSECSSDPLQVLHAKV